METSHLRLQGMSCASCARTIEELIQSVPGVIECNVNFGVEQATVKYNPRQTNFKTIQQAVIDAGYHAQPIQEIGTELEDGEKKARVTEEKEITRKLMVGSIISILLVIGMLPMMIGMKIPWIPAWLQNSWIQLVLVTPVMFWLGKTLLVGGWKAFKRHAADMNTLVALGTGVAFCILYLLLYFPKY